MGDDPFLIRLSQLDSSYLILLSVAILLSEDDDRGRGTTTPLLSPCFPLVCPVLSRTIKGVVEPP
jgi:hypothetical protein